MCGDADDNCADKCSGENSCKRINETEPDATSSRFGSRAALVFDLEHTKFLARFTGDA